MINFSDAQAESIRSTIRVLAIFEHERSLVGGRHIETPRAVMERWGLCDRVIDWVLGLSDGPT